jgi:hypothetical protein
MCLNRMCFRLRLSGRARSSSVSRARQIVAKIFDDLAAPDAQDAVCKRQGLVDIVRHKQYGPSSPVLRVGFRPKPEDDSM